MRLGIVAGLGFAVAVVAAILVVTDSAPRRAGSGNVPATEVAARLAPEEDACERVTVPEGTGALLLSLRPPAADVSVTLEPAAGREVRGVRAEPHGGGRTRFPLSDEPPAGEATLCIENRGTGAARVQGFPEQRNEGGRPVRGSFSLQYLRPGSESWLEVAPEIAHRYGLGKAEVLGPWTMWLALGLVLCAWALAARVLLGEGRRDA